MRSLVYIGTLYTVFLLDSFLNICRVFYTMCEFLPYHNSAVVQFYWFTVYVSLFLIRICISVYTVYIVQVGSC